MLIIVPVHHSELGATGSGRRSRAVEKHTNAIFGKLGFAEEPDLNRRVAAVLLYLQQSWQNL